MSYGRVPDSVFPLPLAPFESMMIMDDRPDYPMTCGAEFTFLGSVDRSALTAAIDQAAARHPLLTSRIQSVGKRRLAWVRSAQSIPVTWLQDGQLDDYEGQRPIDLRTEGGLRASVMSQDETTRLRFDFHHACCDAAGGLAFVEDVLVFYSAGCGNSSLTPRKLDVSKLKHRGKMRNRPQPVVSRIRATAAALQEGLQLAAGQAIPLAPPPSSGSGFSDAWYNHRSVLQHFGEEDLRGLRHEARARGTTLNDLLAGNLFRMMYAWQVEQGAPAANRPLRVVMPVNLRDQEDASMPAANRMAYGFLSLRMADVPDEQQMLTTIHRNTERLRRLRLPQAAFRYLTFLSGIPGALAWLMSPQRCLATAVLTNLGDPTRRFSVTFPRDRGRLVAGNLILDRISSVAPLRPLTRAVFSINTYANRLTLTARCDPAYFSPQHAAWLLRGLVSPPAAGDRPDRWGVQDGDQRAGCSAETERYDVPKVAR